MATDNKPANAPVKEAQDPLAQVREKLSARYQELVKAYKEANSIADRYDIKIRIEEITNTFEILFR